MASLIRMLMALTPDELGTLASRWGIPASSEQRSLTAALYREMTSEFTVRATLSTLSPEQQLVLDYLLARRDAVSDCRGLLRDLPLDEATLERVVAGLSQLGFVGFRADGHDYGMRAEPPRRAGAPWTVYVPEDLAQAVSACRHRLGPPAARIPSLRKALIRLELRDLIHLASRWNIARPERFFKRELVRLIEERLTEREVVHARVATLAPSSQRLYAELVERGGSVLLRDAAGATDSDNRSFQLARSQLEMLFLVHEVETDAGASLYVPDEIVSGERADDQEGVTPPLATTGRPPQVLDRRGTLLDDLDDLIERTGRPDCRIAYRDQRFVVHDSTAQSVVLTPDLLARGSRYCVARLSTRLRLTEVRHGFLQPTSLVPSWRQLPRIERLRAALRVWRTDDRCHRVDGNGPVKPSVPLPIVRRLLSEMLLEARPQTWYTLNSVMRRLRWQLRQAATRGTHPDLRFAAAASLVVLHWLGVVQVGMDQSGRVVAVQPVELLRKLMREGDGTADTSRVATRSSTSSSRVNSG